jgi:16S rRNA (guanine966-N2)-methyltransferase
MRIIAGKYRRRKLYAAPGRITRPIPDRTKEILFERLGGSFAGERVADIFAGTGTMGLEAISRGAGSAVFIENDRIAHELLQRNVETLQIEEATLCWRTDVLRCSFRPRGRPELLPYELIFFDPPFAMIPQLRPGKMFYNSLLRLARAEICSSTARLILRSPKGAQFECPACWTPDYLHTMGSMEIHEFVVARANEG